MHLAVLLIAIASQSTSHPRIPHDCTTKLFDPQNYMNQLPSLSMPYLDSVPIPMNKIEINAIKPTPVLTTRVINVVTKYVNKSPVCIKVVGSKPACQQKRGTSKNPPEYLVTKEYFVNRGKRQHKMTDKFDQLEMLRREIEAYRNNPEAGEPLNRNQTQLHGSETLRSDADGDAPTTGTPHLNERTRELLIEDRLDHLEEILPQYTRLRVYETTTMTVTRTRNNNKVMATLMVKNCIPLGYQRCKETSKKRSSKPPINQFNAPPDVSNNLNDF